MPYFFAAMIFRFKKYIVPLSGVSIFMISAIIDQQRVTLLINIKHYSD